MSRRSNSHSLSFNEPQIEELSRSYRASGWNKKAQSNLPNFLAKNPALKVPQVGIVVIDAGLDPEDYGLVSWAAAYDLSLYPVGIPDDEVVTVVKHDGEKVVSKRFREFGFDELKCLHAGYYWIRSEAYLNENRSWSLTPAQFSEIESAQEGSGWLRKMSGLAKQLETRVGDIPSSLYTMVPVHLRQFSPAVTFLGLVSIPTDDGETIRAGIPFPDHAIFKIYTLDGKIAAEKKLASFSFDEIKRYCVDHFWMLVPVGVD